MSDDATLAVRFKDVENDDETRTTLESRMATLEAEFPETVRIELTLTREAQQVEAHAHAVGKRTNAASQARADDARTAGELALDKLERELRRNHDKMIFSRRREAQKAIGKRN